MPSQKDIDELKKKDNMASKQHFTTGINKEKPPIKQEVRYKGLGRLKLKSGHINVKQQICTKGLSGHPLK